VNPNDVAPMVMAVTFFLVTGGVILLRPLVKRLADLLEVMAQQKRQASDPAELSRIRELLSSLDGRVSLVEERQRFTESLLERRPTAGQLEAARRETGDAGGELPPASS
jgi:hypothetical protein